MKCGRAGEEGSERGEGKHWLGGNIGGIKYRNYILCMYTPVMSADERKLAAIIMYVLLEACVLTLASRLGIVINCRI